MCYERAQIWRVGNLGSEPLSDSDSTLSLFYSYIAAKRPVFVFSLLRQDSEFSLEGKQKNVISLDFYFFFLLPRQVIHTFGASIPLLLPGLHFFFFHFAVVSTLSSLQLQ